MKVLHMFKRLVLLITLLSALLLAFSCNKSPVVEYDFYNLEGRWLVTSVTGPVILSHENIFEAGDNVRFYNGTSDIVISRQGQDRYYDELKDLHYFYKFSGIIAEDGLSLFVLNSLSGSHTFNIVQSSKSQLVLEFQDNGARIGMKKEE